MSTTPAFRRLAAASALAAGALLLTLAIFPGTAPAAPGSALAQAPLAADSVTVELNNVNSSMTAGSRLPGVISARFQNRTNNPITSIEPVFTVQLEGMPGDGVQISRVLGSPLPSESSGNGTVRFHDPSTFELLRSGRRDVAYQLLFTSTAPGGKATLTLEAYANGNRLGGDSASITVKGGAPVKTTPPNTDPGVVPTFAAGTSFAIASPDTAEDQTAAAAASMPPSLYVMGALLVGLGGVLLFLLFRRQKPPLAQVAHVAQVAQVGYPVAENDQPRPTSLGYPRGPGLTRPTAPLPTVRDQELPPTRPIQPGPHSTPHDPWA